MAFNILKGPFFGAAQTDHIAVLKDGETGLVKGSLIKLDTNDEWEIAGASDAGTATADGTKLWLSLQNFGDYQAGMAGKYGGLALHENMILETDQYDGVLTKDQHVTVGAGGKLVAHADGNTSLGTVIAVAAPRVVSVSAENPGGQLTMVTVLVQRTSQLKTA